MAKQNNKFTTTDGEHEWHGEEVEAQSDPLVDGGIGHTVVMRFFEFKSNPAMKEVPTNQELFNAHASQIRLMLWGDGLEPFQALEPRIIRGKDKYHIMVSCIPKAGVSILEKPHTLQELTKPNAA